MVKIRNVSAYLFYPPVTVTDLQNRTTEGVYIVSGCCYQVSSIGEFSYKISTSLYGVRNGLDEVYDAYFVSKKEATINLMIER